MRLSLNNRLILLDAGKKPASFAFNWLHERPRFVDKLVFIINRKLADDSNAGDLFITFLSDAKKLIR